MDAKDGYRIVVRVLYGFPVKSSDDVLELAFPDIDKAVRDPRVVSLLAEGRRMIMSLVSDDPPFSHQLTTARDGKWAFADWLTVRAAIAADVERWLNRGLVRSGALHRISRFADSCEPRTKEK